MEDDDFLDLDEYDPDDYDEDEINIGKMEAQPGDIIVDTDDGEEYQVLGSYFWGHNATYSLRQYPDGEEARDAWLEKYDGNKYDITWD